MTRSFVFITKMTICLSFTMPLKLGFSQAISSSEYVPSSETLRRIADAAKKKEIETPPAKVRIGLRLTPYRKIVSQSPSGEMQVTFRPDKVMKHTLRARIDRANHFYIGDFHIETSPQSLVKKARLYTVRLTVYKRYGAYGKIEEMLGYLDINGKLKGEKGLFVLHGSNSIRMKNKNGEPVVDVVAGYRKVPSPVNKAWSKKTNQATSNRLQPNQGVPQQKKLPGRAMPQRAVPSTNKRFKRQAVGNGPSLQQDKPENAWQSNP